MMLKEQEEIQRDLAEMLATLKRILRNTEKIKAAIAEAKGQQWPTPLT